MKFRILAYSLVFLLFVFAGNVLAGSEANTNTFYGKSSGSATTGMYNTCIGSWAGESITTGQNNTFIGSSAGDANQSGNANTFLGFEAGYKNTTNHNNTFIGTTAGYSTNGGEQNVMLGSSAGMANTSGSNNTYLGYGAGYYNADGSDNTIIGHWAGGGSTTGSGNVFIGKYACTGDNGSNKLCIANAITTTPLIYGDFSSSTLTVNGSLGIGTKTPVRQLHLVGSNATFRMDRTQDTAAFLMVRTDTSGNPQQTFVVGTNYDATNGGSFVINDLGSAVSGGGTNRLKIDSSGNIYGKFVNTSSIVYKDNVRTYENALETVNKLRGVRFDWKDSGQPSVGLIAEEVEKVIPEVVAHDGGNTKGINYASLVGVLVEAVKEQQKTISDYQKLFDEQQNAIKNLQKELTELKEKII